MNKKSLDAIALTIRSLSIDAIESANSGHPGLPMGVAEFGAFLFGEILKHNPKKSSWINRDRFVLSAGHGSMFLYSLLYMAGYDLSLDDIKDFRQIGSKTPGHPEYKHTDGVETTTGPLGQGFANAVGLASAEKMMAARFNTADHSVIDHYTYVLAGDGCMMEGISMEAASFAGHQKLGKLVVFYDSNRISIEGGTDITFTEDVAAKFEALGWHSQTGSAYDYDAMNTMVQNAKAETEKPSLIIIESTIGKGSPNKADSAGVHGAALGAEEARLTKENLGLNPDENFYVSPDALEYFSNKQAEYDSEFDKWEVLFKSWAEANPEKKKDWVDFFENNVHSDLQLPEYKAGDSVATRSAAGAALKEYMRAMPELVGGSADLGPSNNTFFPEYGEFSPENPEGRIIHFGVREHAMAAIANGITLHGGLRCFNATFLVFSDYMRGAVRLSALMKLPVVYVFTHDSIFVGEDGPTHQPVEHLASLRIIPGLTVLRPADAEEAVEAWKYAIQRTEGPTVLALSRQKITVFEKHDKEWQQNLHKGAYIAYEPSKKPEVVIAATGSEVGLAIEAAKKSKKQVRVISVVSRAVFFEQDEAYKSALIPEGVRSIVAEVGVSFGWECIASSRKDLFTIDHFGTSGPGEKVAEYFERDLAGLLKMVDE